MSVKSRIEAFEALSKDSDDSNEPSTKRRFQHPGANRRNNIEQAPSNGFGFSKPAKVQGLADFESDLQEVWSVRKNIHHQKGKQPTSHPSVSSQASAQTASHYSRHGAIPAQQSHASFLPRNSRDPTATSHTTSTTTQHDDDGFSFETKRTPLKEQNSPWNVKKTNYSYNISEEPSKRPVDSPNLVNGVASPPTARRKPNIGEADVVRPTKATELMFPGRLRADEKVSYAKRMANSYKRSVGIGEYTPKQETRSSNSVNTQKQSSTRWKHSQTNKDFNL